MYVRTYVRTYIWKVYIYIMYVCVWFFHLILRFSPPPLPPTLVEHHISATIKQITSTHDILQWSSIVRINIVSAASECQLATRGACEVMSVSLMYDMPHLPSNWSLWSQQEAAELTDGKQFPVGWARPWRRALRWGAY